MRVGHSLQPLNPSPPDQRGRRINIFLHQARKSFWGDAAARRPRNPRPVPHLRHPPPAPTSRSPAARCARVRRSSPIWSEKVRPKRLRFQASRSTPLVKHERTPTSGNPPKMRIVPWMRMRASGGVNGNAPKRYLVVINPAPSHAQFKIPPPTGRNCPAIWTTASLASRRRSCICFSAHGGKSTVDLPLSVATM